MFIKKLELKNFKRFTDLTMDFSEEKEVPKLVLLIGANGSGKSCVFDGFEVMNKILKESLKGGLIDAVFGGSRIEGKYYTKSQQNNISNFEIDIKFDNGENFQLLQSDGTSTIDKTIDFDKDLFYGRTAFRYAPKVAKTTFGTVANTTKDSDRPKAFIDFDSRFENDLETFVQDQLRAFGKNNPAVKQDFINKINNAFANIFGLGKSISLQYIDFELPAEGLPMKFLFKKGDSEINYNFLSAGEKMVFEILFNLVAREKTYSSESIIFLDEIDLHLNTSLQKNLLKEINENWLGDNQVWVASHSLGFIEYAREYDRGAIIDLDNLDFDISQLLKPISKDDPDRKYLDIALGETFLNTLMQELETKYQDKVLVFSEGENLQYLERAREIFAPGLPIRFLDGGGKSNLTSIYKAFSKSKARHIIIFDCDAISENKNEIEESLTKRIFIESLINSNQPSGIENLFNQNFFNFTESYYKTSINNGKSITDLNKKLFCQFILDRNNPDDFINFKPIFEQIQKIIKW